MAGIRVVPPAGFEPALSPPEGDALSPELRGPGPPRLPQRPTWVVIPQTTTAALISTLRGYLGGTIVS